MKTSNISNLITRLRNNQFNQSKSILITFHSSECLQLLDCLKNDGWIERWHFIIHTKKKIIKIFFKTLGRKNVINEISIVSKPRRQIHISLKELNNHVYQLNHHKKAIFKKRYSNYFFETWILATPKGLLTGKKALKLKTAGELLICIR